MAFDDLPEQPKMGPEAEAYAAEILRRSRRVAGSTRVALDLAYGDDYWQKLDLYLPEDAGAKGLPVLVFLHGGGWEFGYKEWMGFMAPAFTDLPAIFVSVSYRLIPQVRFPAPLDDTLSALAWVRRNIAGWGGDVPLLAAAGVPVATIRGCVPVAGSYRFEVGELEARGKRFLARPEDAPEASPIAYVAGNTVPFYLTWGEKDLEHVLKNGPPMVEALAAAGTAVEHEVFPGFDHFDISLDNGNPASRWVGKVRELMRRR
jgi:arylformamidase